MPTDLRDSDFRRIKELLEAALADPSVQDEQKAAALIRHCSFVRKMFTTPWEP